MYLELAVKNLRRTKVRSSLAIVGIIIGVASGFFQLIIERFNSEKRN
jgi:hypothetical protein